MTEPARTRRRRRRRRGQRQAEPPVAARSAPSGVSYVGIRFVRVPPRQVYGMVARLDRLPRWSTFWLRAELVERKPTAATVHLWGYLAGLPIESRIQATLKPPAQITWQQTYGTLLGYGASVELKPVEEGTLVTYRVELAPGVAFLSEVATRQLLVQEVEQTLSRLKWSAERDLLSEEIRLMRGRVAGAEAEEAPPAHRSVPQ